MKLMFSEEALERAALVIAEAQAKEDANWLGWGGATVPHHEELVRDGLPSARELLKQIVEVLSSDG